MQLVMRDQKYSSDYVSSECLFHLLELTRAGYVHLLNEYRMSGASSFSQLPTGSERLFLLSSCTIIEG